MFETFIQIETKAGEPIPWGNSMATVWTRVVRIPFPRRSGGLVWNRPVAVSVQTIGGDKQTLPIHDVTRRAQLWLLSLSLLGAFGLALAARRKTRASLARATTKK